MLAFVMCAHVQVEQVDVRRFPILKTLRWRFSDPDWAAAVVRQPRRTDGIYEVCARLHIPPVIYFTLCNIL